MLLAGDSLTVQRRAGRLKEFAHRIVRQSLKHSQERALARIGREVEVSIAGASLRLDISEMHDYRMYRWISSGEGYEPGTTRLIRSRLNGGMCFVDIGANNGYYSLLASRLVGPKGKVLAFEPAPRAFNRLLRNVESAPIKNIEVFQLALGDTTGQTSLFLSSFEDGLNSTVEHSATSIKVDCTTPDSLFKNSNVDVVKVDAEGAECSILRGMAVTLSRNPAVELVIEWNRKYAPHELYSALVSRFDLYLIKNRSKTALARLVRRERDLPVLANLYCVPKSESPPTFLFRTDPSTSQQI